MHELRAPLADLLTLMRQEGRTQFTSLTYQSAIEHIQSVLSIIDDLLLQQNLNEEVHSWVDPDDVICGLIRTLGASAADKQLRLRYRSKLPPCNQINLNSKALQILVRNLLANAIIHTDEGDVDIIIEAHPGGLHLYIQDSGQGLSGSYIDYLEGRQKDTHSRQNSHGIGLLLVRDAIRILNADIRILSASNQERISDPQPVAERNPGWKKCSRQTWGSAVFGTCYDIHIPGGWKSNQPIDVHGCAAIDSATVDDWELRRRLVDLGVWHNSGGAGARLKLRAKPRPHLLCTDGLGYNHKLIYPFSQRQLYDLLKKINQPGQYKVSDEINQRQAEITNNSKTGQADSRIVLIIDDSPVSQSALAQLFFAIGWIAHEARNGDIAAHNLSRINYDLIVQDACLPGMPVPVNETPRIAISALEVLAAELCQTPGRWLGFCLKPINSLELSDLLTVWRLSTPALPAWALELGKERIGGDRQAAVQVADAALANLIRVWRPLIGSIKRKDFPDAEEIIHKILGGLRYTGLAGLTEIFEKFYDLLLAKSMPNEENLQYLRRAFRQARVLTLASKQRSDRADSA